MRRIDFSDLKLRDLQYAKTGVISVKSNGKEICRWDKLTYPRGYCWNNWVGGYLSRREECEETSGGLFASLGFLWENGAEITAELN